MGEVQGERVSAKSLSTSYAGAGIKSAA